MGSRGSIQVAPGVAGRGLSLSLNTDWGDTVSGVEQLRTQGAGPVGGVPNGRLVAELGFGMDVPGGGLVTPYAGVTLAGDGADSYRLGARLSLGQSFSLRDGARINADFVRVQERGQIV